MAVTDGAEKQESKRASYCISDGFMLCCGQARGSMVRDCASECFSLLFCFLDQTSIVSRIVKVSNVLIFSMCRCNYILSYAVSWCSM